MFTADVPAADERDHMARLCARCPIQGLCADYARTARPWAGTWAGRLWVAGKQTTSPTERTA